MTRPTIIAGNWKLNPPRTQGEQLFQEVCAGASARGVSGTSEVRVVVCPPYPYLGLLEAQSEVAHRVVALGGQDLTVNDWGAFTGAVNGALLREFGALYVVVGHSERRQLFGETDASVGEKVAAALRAELTPILCVGETDAERDAGETFEVVARQLYAGLQPSRDVVVQGPLVIAYEPVWAIGTGRNATPEQAAEVHRFLRNRLAEFAGDNWSQKVPLLYGGSVKPENAAGLLKDPDIDGALIGGASLSAESFLGILDVALNN
ncbi:MAG: triose-phosphate isomerase [Planctomycetota bacterium]